MNDEPPVTSEQDDYADAMAREQAEREAADCERDEAIFGAGQPRQTTKKPKRKEYYGTTKHD